MNSVSFRRLAVAAGLLLAFASACSGTAAPDTQTQQAAADSAAKAASGLQTQVDSLAGKQSGAAAQVADASKRLADFQGSAAQLLDRTASIPAPPAGKVALHFGVAYTPKPLPGQGIEFRQSTKDVNTVWAMESLDKGQPVPAGDPVKDNILFLTPGEHTTLTLVYRNPTQSEVGFLALPHQESPGSLGPNVWLTCFCLAFIYKAPSEGAWYRVIGVAVAPDTPPGSKIDSLYTVLTDPAVFPKD